MSKSEVNVFVTGSNGEVMDRGQFRWRLEIEELAALRVVLENMRNDDLRRVQMIEFVPVSPATANGEQVYIPWLKHRKTYDFSASNPPPPAQPPAPAVTTAQ